VTSAVSLSFATGYTAELAPGCHAEDAKNMEPVQPSKSPNRRKLMESFVLMIDFSHSLSLTVQRLMTFSHEFLASLMIICVELSCVLQTGHSCHQLSSNVIEVQVEIVAICIRAGI